MERTVAVASDLSLYSNLFFFQFCFKVNNAKLDFK